MGICLASRAQWRNGGSAASRPPRPQGNLPGQAGAEAERRFGRQPSPPSSWESAWPGGRGDGTEVRPPNRPRVLMGIRLSSRALRRKVRSAARDRLTRLRNRVSQPHGNGVLVGAGLARIRLERVPLDLGLAPLAIGSGTRPDNSTEPPQFETNRSGAARRRLA